MVHRLLRNIAAITAGLLPGLVAAGLLSLPARADDVAPQAGAAGPAAPVPRRAQFLNSKVPDAPRLMADWVADSRDNGGMPFIIVDKPDAKVFAFDSNAQLLGSASVLVGLARGDDSVPGIGTMPLTAITPDIRTTPAGRFVAGLGHDLGKLDVLWVDYPDAISLHRVINTEPAEHRLQRIVSPAPADHRISYGCINVPAKFFDSVVDPAFKDTKGVVYILPEVKPMQAVFPHFYEVQDQLDAAEAQRPLAGTPAGYEQGAGSVDGHDLAGIVH